MYAFAGKDSRLAVIVPVTQGKERVIDISLKVTGGQVVLKVHKGSLQ